MADIEAFTFRSAGAELIGLVHMPADQSAISRGVLIVVGGPQYRVGAHRQFVHLARRLADAGYPAMRFDYAGTGDSGGEFAGFENVGADVSAAISTFRERCPALGHLTVWGLCDGASVALLHAAQHELVDQLVLVNPWVWGEETEAITMTRYYYARRFLDARFWRKLLSGQVKVSAAIREFIGTAVAAFRRRKPVATESTAYQDQMAQALKSFGGQTLIILSGNDLVARDFEERVRQDRNWAEATDRASVQIVHFEDADHTFSRSDWKRSVAEQTVNWLPHSEGG